MNRIRKLVAPSTTYEPLLDNNETNDGDVDDRSIAEDGESRLESRFSWLEYSIFFLLGIAMLWAWYAFDPRAHRQHLSTPYLGNLVPIVS